MTNDELRKTEAFRWVAVAALKDGSRPIMQCVRVERGWLTAADGFRLRHRKARTGATEPYLVLASAKDEVNGEWALSLDVKKYPDIKRLWTPAQVIGTVYLDPAKVLPICRAADDANKARDKRDRTVSAVMFYQKRKHLYGRASVLRPWPHEADSELLAETRLSTSVTGTGLCFCLQTKFLLDALREMAPPIAVEVCGPTLPVRFVHAFGYEIIMPMFIDWKAVR